MSTNRNFSEVREAPSVGEESAEISTGLRIKLYTEMCRIRQVDEAIAQHYADQQMRCPVHLSVGQEAAASGACCALEKSDYVMSGHRSHGHYVAKGGNIAAMVAELYGKANGCARGKGGSMHLIDVDAGFMGATPIVGSTIPIATGLAFSSKYRAEKRIVMIFLGEGATETGVFFESINFASLRDLPIVFIVENNLYSVYSPLSVRQRGEQRIIDIARAHGMLASRGDGNDVEYVYQQCKRAVDRARSAGGPSLLEFMTYRWREHCGPLFDNDIGYRSETEYQEWRKRCPVETYRAKLIKRGIASATELEKLSTDIQKEIEEAFALAKRSPWPSQSTLLTDVYATR